MKTHFSFISLLILLTSLLPAGAQAAGPRTVTLEGEATFYDDGHHSRLECMKLAAEQARINAIAREFGTVVTQDMLQADRFSSGKETNDFFAMSMTEVKGDWLGDTEEPQYDFSFDKEGNIVVKCRVKGTARQISNLAPDFETRVLRNGIYAANADSRFRNGDDMFLYFIGATDGYLSVWLEDESRNVYNLLPYPRDSKGEVKVKKHKEYVFFNPKTGQGEFGPEEELVLTAGDETEFNRIFILFSPTPYSRPVMKDTGSLPTLPSADFHRWLLKTRRNDPYVGVKSVTIEISPN